MTDEEKIEWKNGWHEGWEEGYHDGKHDERERVLGELKDKLEVIFNFMKLEESKHISSSLRITIKDMLICCWQVLKGEK